jgi:hypothetical protein
MAEGSTERANDGSDNQRPPAPQAGSQGAGDAPDTPAKLAGKG